LGFLSIIKKHNTEEADAMELREMLKQVRNAVYRR